MLPVQTTRIFTGSIVSKAANPALWWRLGHLGDACRRMAVSGGTHGAARIFGAAAISDISVHLYN